MKGSADEDPSSQDHHAPAAGGQAPDHLVDSHDRPCATMTISAAYHARLVTGACWLALVGPFVYALHLLKHLRP